MKYWPSTARPGLHVLLFDFEHSAHRTSSIDLARPRPEEASKALNMKRTKIAKQTCVIFDHRCHQLRVASLNDIEQETLAMGC